MKRSLLLCSLCVLVISAYGLFQIKHRVQNLKRDLIEMHRQITSERESIHMLKAEWAYLNSPQRIEMLANIHLGLSHIKASQVRDYTVLFTPKKQLTQTEHPYYPVVRPMRKPILSSARSYE